MMNFTPAIRTRSASASQSAWVRTTPKWGMGTSWPSTGLLWGSAGAGGFGFVVGDDLVAEEVEVDPVVGAAALRAAQDGAVKVAGGGEIVDGEGDVEGAEQTHR